MDILLFTQPNCPKCPKAKEEVLKKVQELKSIEPVNLVEIDVSTEEGLFEGVQHNVLSTPTIIIKEKGHQMRLTDVSEIHSI